MYIYDSEWETFSSLYVNQNSKFKLVVHKNQLDVTMFTFLNKLL